MHRFIWHAPAVFALVWGLTGCITVGQEVMVPPPPGSVPTELCKQTLPPYVIEPPDILYVEVLHPPVINADRQPYSQQIDPQPINGQFLVRPDGTIGLGIYGSVHVTGLTCDQARDRIREFMKKAGGKDPDILQITVDVAGYNSKVYYVITDGAGFGEPLRAFPVTGSETVLDALARVGGIPPVGSTKRVWIARRSPTGGKDQILPVDYCATAREGAAITNYQVLPGDRIYVQAQPLVSIDNALAKVLAPIERVFGVVLLGSSTVNQISGKFNNGNGNGAGF